MKNRWWAPFAWMVDVALQNAWILHRVNKRIVTYPIHFWLFAGKY